MTSPTHRAFAICWVLIGNIILYLTGMTRVDYYLSMIIMLQMGKCGALFPDVDHNWAYVKEKTAPNWVLNKLIHMTGGEHRSWQTHSIDICAVATIISYTLPKKLYSDGSISAIDMEILNIIMLGFTLGWVSHIVSDMLTPGGVRVFCWKNYKVALVPRRFMAEVFKTGSMWEALVYKVTKLVNIGIGILAVLFPYFIKM